MERPKLRDRLAECVSQRAFRRCVRARMWSAAGGSRIFTRYKAMELLMTHVRQSACRNLSRMSPPNGTAGRMRSLVWGQENLGGYRPWPQTRRLLRLLASVSAGVRVRRYRDSRPGAVAAPEGGDQQRKGTPHSSSAPIPGKEDAH